MGKTADLIRRSFNGLVGVLRPLAAVLPDPAPPKPPKGQNSLPGYRKQVAASAAAITKTDRRLANTDTLTLRNANTTKQVVRNFAIASPDLSATVNAYLRVGLPEQFTVVGRNMDGTVNPNATQLAHEILRRVTFVPDYTQGFNPMGSVNAMAQTLGKEFLYYGAASLEVVLDAARLPIQFAPVHTPSLKFYEDGFGLKPVQEVGGEEIDLDIPTFVYTSLDQDLLDAYSSSWLEAALQPVLADQEFMNDLRRVLKRSIQPRVTATIVEEKLRKAAPLDVLNDPVKFEAFTANVMAQITENLTGLSPEDAIVSFDTVQYSYMDGDQGDVSGNLKAVQDLLNAKLATGAKTMPAILGHGQGGNHASTEAILFVKSADAIRRGVQELLSRCLTVSCRLYGEPCYIEFTFAPIDLRPTSELEAYQAMRQSRILEQLSLGLITDEEASIMLTGNLPPAGAPKLSGTMFKNGTTNAGANPDSNTSAMGQELKPSTPSKPKSPSK
jgi:hypothetical protein